MARIVAAGERCSADMTRAPSAPLCLHAASGSAIAAALSTGLGSAGTSRLRAAWSTGTWTLARIAARTIAARGRTVRIEATRVGVVGREVRRIARVSIRTRGTRRPTLALAGTVASVTARTAITGIAAGATIAIGAWTARTRTTWTTRTRATRTTRTRRFVAIRLARSARSLWIAMTGWTGVHTIRDVPRAHCRRIFATLLTRAQLLALRTRTLGLERFLRLLGSGFATDGQATLLARRAATAAILTHIVEAA